MKKKSQTTWQNIKLDLSSKFLGPQETDIAIIGGGIAGTTIAYYLSRAGKKVTVLDKGDMSRNVTAYTTAFLTRSLDSDLATLQGIFGKKSIKSIVASHQFAIDEIEKVIREENIECEFKRVPNYLFAFNDSGLQRFLKEAKINSENGFPTEIIASKSLPFPTKGGIFLPNQAVLHPLKYVSSLRERAKKYGVKFFDNTKVTKIEGQEKITITTQNGILHAKQVVVATYNPFSQPWWYVFKKGMYVSYVYEISIPKGTLPYGIYEDDNNPYHYFRVEDAGDRDRMIIGGEDHRREIPIDRKLQFKALRKYIEKKLKIKNYQIVKEWTGPILEQTDGLAMIGREGDKHPNRYYATGFSGNGMTYATISGILIRDLILGNKNSWEKIYDPSRRIRLRAVVLKGRDYLDEFVGGMVETISANMKIKFLE